MNSYSLLLASLALTVIGQSAAATTVYRSVDDNGVVTFSDVAPENGDEAETLVIDTPATQPDTQQQQQLEAMRETTDRMVADRQAREKHRAELRELQAKAKQSASTPPGYTTQYTTAPFFSGSYYGSRYYRPFPGHRPDKPSVRPPLRPKPEHPVAQPRAGHNSYPASLVRRHYQPAVRQALGR